MSVWVDFRVLKQSLGIEQVLGSYGVELKRVGHHQLRGPCPLPTHGSVGGNVLDLVAWLEGCSIRNAALRLQEQWWGGRASDHYQLAAKEIWPSSPLPLPPLSFSLRLHWHPYLQERGVHPSTAACFGIGYYTGSGFLHHRVVFPVHDSQGQLVAYVGRSLDGSQPRYLFPPGFRKVTGGV